MVEENVMNDQKLLQNLFLERGAIRSDCCNRRTTRQEASLERSQSEEVFTYCLLDEFVFQNGMMEFFCSSGRRGSSVALYVLGMHAAIPSAAKLPMTVHPNYCGDKLLALNRSGLLLYDNTTDRCSRWNPDLTSFARRNWTIEVAQAKRSLQDLQEVAMKRWLEKKARLGSASSSMGRLREIRSCSALVSLSFLQPTERMFCLQSETLRQFFGGIAQWPELTGADFVSSDDQLWLAVPRGPDIHPMSRSQLLHQKTKEGRTHGLSHPVPRLPVKSALPPRKVPLGSSSYPSFLPSVMPSHSPSAAVNKAWSSRWVSLDSSLLQQVALVVVAIVVVSWIWCRKTIYLRDRCGFPSTQLQNDRLKSMMTEKILKGLTSSN